MAQITVISGPERRRRSSAVQKLKIVEAAMAPEASVLDIARGADLSPSSIYKWRREIIGVPDTRPKGFTAVAVHPEPDRCDPNGSGTMVIEFGGATVRVGNATSAGLLVAALRKLRR
jgi:transposase